MTARPAPAPALPVDRECPYVPHHEQVRLSGRTRAAQVTLPSGDTVWALTRHEDVRAVLADTRFSSNRGDLRFPTLYATQRLPGQSFRTSLISMDPPAHTLARRALMSEFTVRRVQALRPRIAQIVAGRLDAMLAGPRPADLVASLCLPVPSLVICELLGVPYERHDFFQSRSSRLLQRTASAADRIRANDELAAYLAELIAQKEQTPGDDLLSRQIARRRAEGGADREALVNLAGLLLIAGHETTANMISLGTMALLEHPEIAAELRADPAAIPGAVEELLRSFTIAELAVMRFATEDVDIAGVRIRAGEGVLPLTNLANHDPEVFGDPDALDIRRAARPHVAFGFGPHQCIGQNLARAELEIAFAALLTRAPGLRAAAPAGELPFKRDALIYGLHEFLVTW